ncbi:hypothetical protein U0070_020936, partial [Myodes glareolus]
SHGVTVTSKNHTKHRQSLKWHRNNIKKPQPQDTYLLERKDLKFWGNMQFARKHKSELRKIQASNAKEVEAKVRKGGDHMLCHLTHSKPMNQVHAHMATDLCAIQRQRPRRASLGQTKMPSEAPKGAQASGKVTEKAGRVDKCATVTPLPSAAF